MRMIIKLFVVIVACAAISFAQTKSAATPPTTTPSTVVSKAVTPQGPTTFVPQKQPTNWTKIKDLFL